MLRKIFDTVAGGQEIPKLQSELDAAIAYLKDPSVTEGVLQRRGVQKVIDIYYRMPAGYVLEIEVPKALGQKLNGLGYTTREPSSNSTSKGETAFVVVDREARNFSNELPNGVEITVLSRLDHSSGSPAFELVKVNSKFFNHGSLLWPEKDVLGMKFVRDQAK